MASAIITRVLSLLDSFAASIAGSEAPPPCLAGLHEDIAELQRTMTSIRAAVHSAEERQAFDEAAKLWLVELRALAYDAEDVIEDFNYKLLRPVDGALLWRRKLKHDDDQVRDSSSPPAFLAPPSVRVSMAQRMKELRERLDDIARDREALRPREEGGAGLPDNRSWRSSGGVMDGESPVFGRDKDKEEILKLLLLPSADEESSAAKLSVLPIVGMAGLGKTTLAQLVYNDDQMKHFDQRMWIHVSQGFNLIKLTRAMVTCVTGKSCSLSDLHSLQAKLKENLEDKCFFLVLDDVWDESRSHWESRQTPLLSAREGSKVLLTTRTHGVAKSIGTMPSYNLESLKGDDCWSLFCEHAFHGQAQDERLVKIGKKIVQKCRGLPLSLKVLGLHLQGEELEDKWSEILESNMWDLSGCQDSILPILTLSYIHLPAPVKQCFTYCSVFDKGHRFLRHKIVRMWMAQGFIETDGRRKAEDIGSEYFDVLLSRSFFQHSEREGCFVMHDLIHDLAESISGGECFKIDVLPGGDRAYNFPRHVRHCSLTIRSTSTEADLQPLLAAESLRTLLLNYTSRPFCESSLPHPHANVLNDLLMQLKYLRVLVLNYTFAPDIPNSVGNLKFLRYLGIVDMILQSFPRSICSLRNLETLEWDSPQRIHLPQGISNLINLRCLDGPLCAAFPEGIGRLTKLQKLPDFRVSSRSGYAGIAELKDLKNLQGELRMLNLENVINLEDAVKANLKGKPHLTSLDLRWSMDIVYPNNASLVLQSLQPHTNIQEVTIYEYRQIHLSEWLCHPSYSKLVTIRLRHCTLSALPAFGQLLSLKHLSLEYIGDLRYISPTFFDGGFPSLKKLSMIKIEQLVGWFGVEPGQLPHLNELVVAGCHSLKSLPLGNLTALQELWISCCSDLQTLYSESSPPSMGIQKHRSLKHLEIVQCPELKFLSEYQVPANLQFLNISRSTLLINWCHRNAGKLLHVQRIRGVDSREVKLNDIFTVKEARNVCLERQCIYMLDLEWEPSSIIATSGTYDEANEVLECLQPNASLNRLVMRGYNGSRFSGWLCSPFYSNLVSMRLDSCPNCKVLPALGRLQYLMELYLERLHGIKTIDLEFYGNDTKNRFKSLRRLELISMANLEVWQGASDGEFPTLRQLNIKDCMRLRGLPCLSPSVQEIKVQNCPQLILGLSSNLSSLLDLHVSNISMMMELRRLSYLSVLIIENCMGHTLAELPALRDLVVSGCNKRMLLDSLPGLTLLTTLKISCLDLESLPLHNFRILEELVISDCPNLISIECFSTSSYEPYYIEGLLSLSSLKRMTLTCCPQLHFSASERLPPTLQSLTISRCALLRIWYQRYSTRFNVSGIRFDD